MEVRSVRSAWERCVVHLILRSLLPPDFFRLDSYGENPAEVYASEASFLTESF